jgi:hypothetical protein
MTTCEATIWKKLEKLVKQLLVAILLFPPVCRAAADNYRH